jgi:hypothetical protein
VLLDAADYADDLKRDSWEFAVTIRDLRALGLSDNDLRWLVCKRIVDVAVEVTEPGETVRTYRPSGSAMFSDRACFSLAEGARGLALLLTSERTGVDTPANGHSTAIPVVTAPALPGGANQIPVWDCDRQELRFRGQLIKQFKVPSPNQETILAAFEEEHWPPRIDDPLPPQADQEPKRRLHDTINTLNRNQKNPLIRFLGDGSGQGVRWEPVGDHPVRNGKSSRDSARNAHPGEPSGE